MPREKNWGAAVSSSILITGGAGFIGSHLVDLINQVSPQTKVRVLDDFSSGKEANLSGANVEVFQGSILDDELLNRAVHNTSVVVHLAALGGVQRSVIDPVQSHAVNVTGTLRVLEASRRSGVTQAVFASSSSVYGSNPKLPRSEDDWVGPMSPYASSKIAGESYVLSYGQVFGLRTMAFRFFNVYGPRQRADHQYAAVIPRFIQCALTGEPLTIEGDGSQSRDFTYVSSVVYVLWETILRQLSDSRPVNLAFGERTSILELSRIVGRICGIDLEVGFVGGRPGDVQASQADNRKLLAIFPGLSQVDLALGIRDTVEWHRNQ